MKRQMVTRTRKVLFEEVTEGQSFYTFNEGNGEIIMQFRKVGVNLAQVTGLPLSKLFTYEINHPCIVAVSVH